MSKIRIPLILIFLTGLLLLNGWWIGRAEPLPWQSSSALAITGDGRTLIAVNPDSDSVTVVDLDTMGTQEIPVGRDPRTVSVDGSSRWAAVASYGSDTVSIIDLYLKQVAQTISTGKRPYGVVLTPDGESVFVAEQGADTVSKYNRITGQRLWHMATLDRPSGLALTGSKLWVTHLFVNQLSVITVQPQRSFLPFLSTAEATALPTSTVRLFPNSNLVQAIVLSPDGQTAFIPHTRANDGNRALTVDSTLFPLVSQINLGEVHHLTGEQFDLATIDPPAVGLPFDGVVTPDGRELWVLNAASNDITVINLYSRQLTAHIEVGANPRGIAINPDGQKLYVNNVLDGKIAIISTAAYTVTGEISTTTIPLDPLILQGKKLFYSSDDPRLGQDQWMSCQSCHFDGEHDGRTWQLGFAGPRNTPSLRGMNATLPLRWSGEWDEAADAEFAIRMDSFGTGLVSGAMHCDLSPPDCVNHPPHAGTSADLDALAAFLNSLGWLEPPPADPETATAINRGAQLFENLGCTSCHAPPLYTDNLLHDIGTATADERIGPAFNTPSLLGLNDSAPYFHDGRSATLTDALQNPGDNGTHQVALSAAELNDLVLFLQNISPP
ncbi:MAG: cytochrome c peroxidase [Ardenticatenaceae bacterium]|nr:cytochrome c peroxidase [Ardenticatenaceae bacterium]